MESTVKEQDVYIKKAIEKWGPKWPESTCWSDRPDVLVADFVRAVSEDLLNEYGNQAIVRAGQLLAGNAVARGKKNLTFSAGWLAANASVCVELSFEKPQHTEKEMGLSISMDVPEEMDELDIRKEIDHLSSDDQPPHITLDPLTMVPDLELAKIARQMEDHFADDGISLMGAAAITLIWRAMEAHRSTDFQLSISGLNNKGTLLAPGLEAVFSGKAKLMDRNPETEEDKKNLNQKVTVAFRKSKPQ